MTRNKVGGSERLDPDRKELLRAGELQTYFQAGRLVWISRGDEEIVRRVYVAIRDASWRTVPFEIEHLDAEVGDDWFSIEYRAFARDGDIDFRFDCTFRGGPASEIVTTFEGEALSSFQKNRIGVCVHYPHELAGAKVAATPYDGGRARFAAFPSEVAPHQPVGGLGHLVHDLRNGDRARVTYRGDVFEMEDQRNWSDASYKVYSTPLAEPLPVSMARGERIVQSVSLEVLPVAMGSTRGAAKESSEEAPQERFMGVAALRTRADALGARLRVGVSICERIGGYVPRLGTDATAANASRERTGAGLNERGSAPMDLMLLKRLDHLRFEVPSDADCAVGVLVRGLDLCARLGVWAYPVLLVHGSEGLDERVLKVVVERAREICAIGVTGDGPPWASAPEPIMQVNRALKAAGATIPVGAGTVKWFTELNRNPPPAEISDFVFYAITPQMHVFDDDGVMENVVGQLPPLRGAQALAPGRAVHVGPVTMRPRRAFRTCEDPASPATEHRDPRLDTPFGAAWSLATVAVHSTGADRLTLFEATGPEAIVRGGAVGQLLDRVARLQGRCVLESWSSSPRDVAVLPVVVDDRLMIYLANLSDRSVDVDLELAGELTVTWEGNVDTVVSGLRGHHREDEGGSMALAHRGALLAPFEVVAVGASNPRGIQYDPRHNEEGRHGCRPAQ